MKASCYALQRLHEFKKAETLKLVIQVQLTPIQKLMNKYPRRAQNLNISIKCKIKHVFQITTKTNNEPNFQYTKLSVIELVLTDKRNLSGARPRSACGKSFSCRFSLSAARNVITKATEYL